MFAMGPAFFGAASSGYAALILSGTYAGATVGVAYSSDLTISGGNGSYSNPRVTVGTLPTWATLSVVGDKLRLSGTPTGSATTVNITAAVDSGDGQTATSAQSVVVAVGDPYWAQVVALLHCDGVDGSTVVTDEKGVLSWSVGANTSVDNSVTLIAGGAFKLSGLVGSDISYLSVPKAGWSFAADDFCLDITVRPLSLPGAGLVAALFSNGDVTGPTFYGLRWYINPDGSVGAIASTDGTSIGLTMTSAAGVVSAGSRSRLRLSRSGPSFKLFAEGATIASGTLSGALYRPTLTPNAYIGRAVDRSGSSTTQAIMAARVDEYRMTIGSAREHADYTPSSTPFPNS